MSRPSKRRDGAGPVFWKIAGAGAAFQAGSSAVDSATIVASLVYQLTGNVFAVGAASAVLRLGWLLPQIAVGFLAQRAGRRMPFYVVGAFGRAICLALVAALFAGAGLLPQGWIAGGFLGLWTLYAFVSGIVAVPYNDIVGRSIPSGLRSRMLALRFFGGGVLALMIAAIVHHLLASEDLVRQANWQKVGGASPPERRSNRTTFLREPCVGSREGAGEASVAAWMGRAIEHRKSDGPGCRGFQIGRNLSTTLRQ